MDRLPLLAVLVRRSPDPGRLPPGGSYGAALPARRLRSPASPGRAASPLGPLYTGRPFFRGGHSGPGVLPGPMGHRPAGAGTALKCPGVCGRDDRSSDPRRLGRLWVLPPDLRGSRRRCLRRLRLGAERLPYRLSSSRSPDHRQRDMAALASLGPNRAALWIPPSGSMADAGDLRVGYGLPGRPSANDPLCLCNRPGLQRCADPGLPHSPVGKASGAAPCSPPGHRMGCRAALGNRRADPLDRTSGLDIPPAGWGI